MRLEGEQCVHPHRAVPLPPVLCLLHLLLPPSSNFFPGAQPRDERRLWGSCCEVGGDQNPLSHLPRHPWGRECSLLHSRSLTVSLGAQTHRHPLKPQRVPSASPGQGHPPWPLIPQHPQGGRIPSALGSRGQGPLSVPSARGGPEGREPSAAPGADPSRRQRPEAGVPASRSTDPALRGGGEGGPAWALHGPAPPLSAPFGLGWSCSRPFIPGLNLGCARAAASRPPRPGRVSSAPCNWLEGARARVIRWGGRLAAPRRPPSRPAAPWR